MCICKYYIIQHDDNHGGSFTSFITEHSYVLYICTLHVAYCMDVCLHDEHTVRIYPDGGTYI